MAGTMVHLVIATELINKLKTKKPFYFNIKNNDIDDKYKFPRNILRNEDEEKHFLVGNVCPDRIHAREHYERSMKKHTLFRDDIPDPEFHYETHLKVFHNRLEQFANDVLLNVHEREYELYLGYITHILSDEYFMLKVRPVFLKTQEKFGLGVYDDETFIRFTYDVNMIDFRLAREYRYSELIYRYLQETSGYSIEGMLTKDELDASRQWILKTYFDTEHEKKDPLYISYEEMWEFIDYTVDKLIECFMED